MTAYFANPWGLLALLGLPVVLAIHFLQRRTREIAVSTLFLLDAAPLETRAGRRLERLVPSVPLWLQLLMVVLLATVVAEPRWPWQVKSRRLAVVVDDSASMLVAKDAMLDRFAAMAREVEFVGARAEYLILPADPNAPRLYAGNRSSEAQSALEKLEMIGGPVDPVPALRLARERVGPDGIVVWMTDTPVEKLPADAALVSVGKVTPNVGISGVTFSSREGRTHWEALVVNRSPRAESRQWHLEWDKDGRSAPAEVRVEPGQFATIGGPMPVGATRLQLVLSPDAFPVDDCFPFVKPEPRPLWLQNNLPKSLDWMSALLRKGVPALEPVLEGDVPDLLLAGSSDGVFPALGNAVLMSLAEEADAAMLDGVPVAARHPLNEGLVWDGLAVGGKTFLPALPGDTPLLWIDGKPVISLREKTTLRSPGENPAEESINQTGGPSVIRQLVLHFHPSQSNFARLPAAAILLLRFCEELRANKAATTWERVDPGQSLSDLLPDGGSPLQLEALGRDGNTTSTITIEPARRNALRAPVRPGFFRVRDGEMVLLEGAVAFADGREGDFSVCATRDTFDAAKANATRGDRRDETWWKLAVLAVLAILLVSWYFLGRQPVPSTR